MVGIGAEEVTSLLCHSDVSSPGCIHDAWKQFTVAFFIFKAKEEDFDTWVWPGCALGLKTSAPIISIIQIPAAWMLWQVNYEFFVFL